MEILGPFFIWWQLLVWLAFGSVAAAAACVAVNLILPSGGWHPLHLRHGDDVCDCESQKALFFEGKAFFAEM